MTEQRRPGNSNTILNETKGSVEDQSGGARKVAHAHEAGSCCHDDPGKTAATFHPDHKHPSDHDDHGHDHDHSHGNNGTAGGLLASPWFTACVSLILLVAGLILDHLVTTSWFNGVIRLIWILTVVWFFLTFGAIGAFLILYRRRAGRRASYVRGERLREALWILVPVAVVLVLDLWLDFRGAPVWAKVKIERPVTELALQVTGKQFNWEVLHPGPDGRFGDDSWKSRLEEVQIRSSGEGLEAWADLTVRVPKGQKIALHLGVGEASLTNVDGEVFVDCAAAGVTASGMRGRFTVDTGSGTVQVSDVQGLLSVDTGSGSVDITQAKVETKKTEKEVESLAGGEGEEERTG